MSSPEEPLDDLGINRTKRQYLALTLVSAILCCAVAVIFYADVAFLFQGKIPKNLGDASDGFTGLADNLYVELSGQGDHRSKFADVKGRPYKYFLILGSPVLIEQPARGVRATGEIVIQKYKGSGRLRKLSQVYKYDMLLDNIKESIGVELKENGYILQEGVTPARMRVPAGLVLATMALMVFSAIKYALAALKGRRVAQEKQE